jgi:Tol biopolymer transport system component
MADLREVFEMVTNQVRPDQDAWQQQERRQRRAVRRRRVGGFTVGAAIVVLAGVLALTLGRGGAPTPAHRPSPKPATIPISDIQPITVGLDGAQLSTVPGFVLDGPTVPHVHFVESLAPSPDGTRIAFAAQHDGVVQIATMGIDGTDLRWLTQYTQDIRTLLISPTPAWSPDGSRIAYVDPNGQIAAVDVDGSHQTELTSDPGVDQWPAWSPDGSTIAYSNSPTGLGESGFADDQEIRTVPSTGGSPTRLTDDGVWDDMPAYSPDGTRIAFIRQGSIWLMDPSGQHAHRLPGQSGDSFFNPRWSPDGSTLVVDRYEGARSADDQPLLSVVLIDVASGKATPLRVQVERDHNAAWWLPSGQALLVSRYVP